jgi:hypothetical protein
MLEGPAAFQRQEQSNTTPPSARRPITPGDIKDLKRTVSTMRLNIAEIFAAAKNNSASNDNKR